MRRVPAVLAVLIALSACGGAVHPAVNPDPNHTHADFVVWMDGTQVDFSQEKYMAEHPDEEGDHDHSEHEHGEEATLHLHDGVGHMIHSHKPGQTLREFFASLHALDLFVQGHTWRMFINGQEEEFTLDYAFQDLDHIFLTTSSASAQVLYELEQMTDDACLYSKTCPERGEPPAENCVADASIPCVVPPEDL
ncbi:hypothetical protein COU76_01730 [Candidatus Peregrinibacteria bacterium CG10_big_fil_rev_8_21_14_0_10_49_10]|nr:MAG: hypothetical protein COU76_01730 [Candidatus Peregrinibacteria bacterium CG10_big_fil_rev_8_21_14_0_10_49_10]